jgi:hypothetical protein
MPVTFNREKDQLIASPMSPRCYKPGSNINAESVPQEFNGVKFQCTTSQSKDILATGIVGGSYEIQLYNSKGRLNPVGFTLQASSTNSNKQDLLTDIVQSFKLN